MTQENTNLPTPSESNLPASTDGAPAAKRKELKVEAPAKLARPDMREKPTVVLGGGPAGLTAAYLLAKLGLPVVVLEAEDQVGGIAKTAVRDGYRFDLGGASLLHQGEGGRRALARDHARGVPEAPADVSHLLERQVPRLPAARARRDQEARPG